MLILPLLNQVYSSNITAELGIEYRSMVFTFSIIQVGVSGFNGKIYSHIIKYINFLIRHAALCCSLYR